MGRQRVFRCLRNVICICFFTMLYNEFLVYYILLSRCEWPQLHDRNTTPLQAMFIADTHLLGPTGHWWDRLRREWQMQRAFQTSVHLHSPSAVFILGDLFDDGKWETDDYFNKDVARFRKMFQLSSNIELVSVIGNHDVGFHYMIDEHKLSRFVKSVNSSSSVELLHERGVSFVTVNSMAMEGDRCSMCAQAERDLKAIKHKLDCSKKNWPADCSDVTSQFTYSAPVLLQHFPMYRESDSECVGIDSTPEDEKLKQFRPKLDCLSQDASQQLMEMIQPRLIVSAHTHHFCLRTHDNGVQEWSVPSFSWRNKKGSSFLLASFTAEHYQINKCYMPNENTVYMVYSVSIAVVLFYTSATLYAVTCDRRKRPVSGKSH